MACLARRSVVHMLNNRSTSLLKSRCIHIASVKQNMRSKPTHLFYRPDVTRRFLQLSSSVTLRETSRNKEIINFDDYRNAFKHKSLWELTRALFVLRLCSFDTLVDNSLRLMNIGQKILGKTLFAWLMRRTMYGQFVAGETVTDIHNTTERLAQSGISPLLAVPIEEDVDECQLDGRYDENLEAILNCIKLSSELDKSHAMIQLKVTALMSGDLCAKLSALYPSPHLEEEVLDHITTVMLGRAEAQVDGLEPQENKLLTRSLKRFQQAGELAQTRDVIIWVDAEYTYLNPALSMVAMAMMMNFNEKKPIVAHTYQNYLKATFEVLKNHVEFIEGRGLCFAAKLVRGAYMDTERHLAEKLNYEDPVHPTLEDTSSMYHQSMGLLLHKIAVNSNKYRMIIATHNENTIQLALKSISDLEINPCGGYVFFGQLLGMCDQVSYSLGQSGYLVYKSLPYGTLEDTMPYLTRRAQENRAVLKGVRRERSLLWKAFRERVAPMSPKPS